MAIRVPSPALAGRLAAVVDAVYTQDGFDIRLDWGGEGLTALMDGGCATVVIVDVLSFSTAVDIAVGKTHDVTCANWSTLAICEKQVAGSRKDVPNLLG